jgi:hypothetical protein
MITQVDKEKILSTFPNIKLSYGIITHKKVSDADFIVAIPKGPKCFAWFTKYDSKNVCFIMDLIENKQIKDIKIMNCCCNDELYNGTIFYGTTFYGSNNKFFTIEDIFYYKGKNISSLKWENKLVTIKNIMENDSKQLSYNNTYIVFGLPIISNNFDILVKEISELSYDIYSLHFKYYNKFNNLIMPIKYVNEICNSLTLTSTLENQQTLENHLSDGNTNKKNNYSSLKMNTKREKVFFVKPDIQNDIYFLYCKNDDNNNNNKKDDLEYYSTAYIPDYKTSVMMNDLFRNIKENKNLDALEESDDEEEFQNEKEDRFVYLDKSYNMICHYNYKFKKWYPVRVV